jgi:hypothetical protein
VDHVEHRRSDATMDVEGTGPSFERDIKPLFREKDRGSMLETFDLWSHEDVAEHADAIAAVLSEGAMPCDGAWPQDQIETFRTWVEAGMLP